MRAAITPLLTSCEAEEGHAEEGHAWECKGGRQDQGGKREAQEAGGGWRAEGEEARRGEVR